MSMVPPAQPLPPQSGRRRSHGKPKAKRHIVRSILIYLVVFCVGCAIGTASIGVALSIDPTITPQYSTIQMQLDVEKQKSRTLQTQLDTEKQKSKDLQKQVDDLKQVQSDSTQSSDDSASKPKQSAEADYGKAVQVCDNAAKQQLFPNMAYDSDPILGKQAWQQGLDAGQWLARYNVKVGAGKEKAAVNCLVNITTDPYTVVTVSKGNWA
ncbi:hypothetical protein [Bifidobacterium callitrichos]|nr:hypothetical protein [Bifidobacterium callitrichos]